MTECTCGTPSSPQKCSQHTQHYFLHSAEGKLDSRLDNDWESRQAFHSYKQSTEIIMGRYQKEIEQLKRLVYEKTPTKNPSFRWMRRKKPLVDYRGSASDYEVWLRTKEYDDLYRLKSLFISGIDILRYQKRFVEHEIERRHLYSQYGSHPLEVLLPEEKS